MPKQSFLVLLTIALLGSCFQVYPQNNLKSQFIDSLDGALDVSYFLASVYGFLPFVMPVTEPALGYGVAGGPVFIHRDIKALKRGDPSPPSLTILGGMYTQNGSWGLGGGHSGIWKHDRIRYLGAAFYGSLNLTYYPSRLPLEFKFNLSTLSLIQQVAFRLGQISLFAGARYQFSQTKVTIERILDIPGLESWEFENNLGGIGPVLFLDYRDNTFTPNKGVYLKGTYSHYAPWVGSHVTYNQADLYGLYFANPTSWLVTGLRAELQSSWGEIPFFAKPYVNLRGIPALRYQNYSTLTFETEERFNLTGRWSLTLFGGFAKAFNPEVDFGEFNWVYNYGAGFRYEIARLFKLHSGIDFAWGPDSWGFYLVFGHSWNRL
ncbi:MAG: hypothetical protein KAR19_16715 [Bacteroidales bacterium]|nr:hypothetical protein [Bacteroidales bacterium]